MSFTQELTSWFSSPAASSLAPPPKHGDAAPSSPLLNLKPNTPAIVVFLRHCGCPFAEKTFLNLRTIATENKNLDFIAVSHSDESSTQTWLKSLPQAGSEPSNLRVVVDAQSDAYAQWGLGPSSFAHVLHPSALSSVWRLAKEEGISNRPTESGSRWQTAGAWGVDGAGKVVWGGKAERADEIPDFGVAVEAVKGGKTGA